MHLMSKLPDFLPRHGLHCGIRLLNRSDVAHGHEVYARLGSANIFPQLSIFFHSVEQNFPTLMQYTSKNLKTIKESS